MSLVNLSQDAGDEIDAFTRLRNELAATKARLDVARAALAQVVSWHSDPESPDYNGCDKDPCAWCEEALAALNTPAADTWQPIGTAPKDGTRVLLWRSGEMEIGYWSTSLWVTRPNDSPLGKQDGAWIMHENRSDTIELTPTHWSPLPSPPSADTGGKEAT